MTGREKCKVLKEIRRKQAESLGIDLHQRECTYTGPCKGTCPKCKAEEVQLNAELLKRKALAVGGAVGIALSLSACAGPGLGSSNDLEGEAQPYEPEGNNVIETIEGDIAEPVDNEPGGSGNWCDPKENQNKPWENPENNSVNDPNDIIYTEGVAEPPEYDPIDYYTEGEIEAYTIEGDIAYDPSGDGNGGVVNKSYEPEERSRQDIDALLDQMFMMESD